MKNIIKRLYLYKLYSYLMRLFRVVSSKRAITTYLTVHKVAKLQLGSGVNQLSGWLNTDLIPSEKGIIYLDVTKKFSIPSESMSYIFSEHMLEHLEVKDSYFMLRECYRVLEFGGVLRLSIPNIEFLIDIYNNPTTDLNKNYVEWATKKYCQDLNDYLPNSEFKHIYAINNFFTSWGHKVIHSVQSISELLKEVGFQEVKQVEVRTSDHQDLENIEMHGKTISNAFNQLESLVVEAKKLS